jgi:hypothetical protein
MAVVNYNQPTNTAIIKPEDSVDERVRDYFANYFQVPFTVTQEEYERVKTYFLQQTNNAEVPTASLTAAVIQAANELKLSIADVMTQFETSKNYTATLALYLNMSRRATSLLGYIQDIQPQLNMQRQVRL